MCRCSHSSLLLVDTANQHCTHNHQLHNNTTASNPKPKWPRPSLYPRLDHVCVPSAKFTDMAPFGMLSFIILYTLQLMIN